MAIEWYETNTPKETKHTKIFQLLLLHHRWYYFEIQCSFLQLCQGKDIQYEIILYWKIVVPTVLAVMQKYPFHCRSI